jgi:hypothetical protein
MAHEKFSTVLSEARGKVVGSDGRLAVTMNEAAAMIGISRRTLENYVRAKLIPVRKIGTRTVVLVSSCHKFLRSDQPSVGRKRQRETHPDSENVSAQEPHR